MTLKFKIMLSYNITKMKSEHTYLNELWVVDKELRTYMIHDELERICQPVWIHQNLLSNVQYKYSTGLNS